jgi:hypothetical protein
MMEGKKTYFTALLLGLATFARAVGYLEQSQYEIILGLMGSMGLAALRSAVSKG